MAAAGADDVSVEAGAPVLLEAYEKPVKWLGSEWAPMLLACSALLAPDAGRHSEAVVVAVVVGDGEVAACPAAAAFCDSAGGSLSCGFCQ